MSALLLASALQRLGVKESPRMNKKRTSRLTVAFSGDNELILAIAR
jgi:hypothetical protein